MNITGKGIIMLQANDTFNCFSYEDNKELRHLITRFYKTQGLKNITIVDCEDKKVFFVDDDNDYKKIMEIGVLNK